MKLSLIRKDAMSLNVIANEHTLITDARSPLGHDQGMTPKELVGAGLGGCTAMDVIALLNKHKQTYEKLSVDVDIKNSTGVQPAVFTEALITFNITGQVDKNILLDSVMLSQTKFCGVSAMLVKAFPIKYKVFLNNEIIGEGAADFTTH